MSTRYHHFPVEETPSISPELQLLNFLEVFGHKHGAAVLRKELGIDNPAMENRPSLKPQSLARFYSSSGYDQEEECKNRGYCAENWEWPDIKARWRYEDLRIKQEAAMRRAELKQQQMAMCGEMVGQILGDNIRNMAALALDPNFNPPQPTRHHFIKSDGTPIYPLPKKRRNWIELLILLPFYSFLCTFGLIGFFVLGYANDWAGYFAYAAMIPMGAMGAWDSWHGTIGQPLFLKPRKGGAK